jgi:hypothetical protein
MSSTGGPRANRESRSEIKARGQIASGVCLLAVAFGVVACGGEGGGQSTQADGGAASGTDSGLPQGGEPVHLDPADFTTQIDNPYWPMAPGSRWVYRETDSEGTKGRIELTIPNRTKRIANGIEARVVHDVVTENGEFVEVTDDWYAQDSAGNIWYMGEKTAEYKHGKVKTTKGSFEAGVDGAQPGIAVPARPEPGMSYSQEYDAGKAEDRGQVVSLDGQVEVPFGHFTDVLTTRDTSRVEPKYMEFVFFVRNVGYALGVEVSGGSKREELVSYSPGG